MWILTSPGPALENKKKWLRPGSSYIIGRKSPKTADGKLLHIVPVRPKWVSRQHLQIVVESVVKGASKHTSIRSKLIVKDMGTNLGSMIGDSVKIASNYEMDITNLASNGPIKIRLAARDHEETTFILQWEPCILVFSSGESDQSQHEQFEKRLVDQVESLDVKVLSDWHPLTTQYVVPEGKKSSRILYSLVQEVPIVLPTFVDALAASAGAMEEDFTKGYPSAADYIADPSYIVNPKRRDVLEGYLFIFCEEKQRDSLLGVITSAGGKTLFLAVTSRTTPQDIVDSIESNTTGGLRSVIFKYPVPTDSPTKQQLDTLLKLDEASRLMGLCLLENSEFVNTIVNATTAGLVKTRSQSASASVSLAKKVDSLVHSESVAPVIARRPVKRRPQQVINFLDIVKDEASFEPAPKKQKLSSKQSMENSSVPISLVPEQLGEAPSATSVSNGQTLQPITDVEHASPPTVHDLSPRDVPALDNDSSHPENDSDFASLFGDDQEEESEDVTDEALKKIQELTIVENIHLDTRKCDMVRSVDPRWTDRPNYKAFRPKGGAALYPVNRPRSETVTQVTDFFQKRDRETMEMLEGIESKSGSVKKIRGSTGSASASVTASEMSTAEFPNTVPAKTSRYISDDSLGFGLRSHESRDVQFEDDDDDEFHFRR